MKVIALLVIASYTCAVHATSYCEAPPAIENGYHSGGGWTRFSIGKVIQYSCRSGYQLQGSAISTCLLNRNTWSSFWSNRACRCIRRDLDDEEDSSSSSSDSDSSSNPSYCSRLSSPANGKVWFSSTSIGSISKYTCNSGYTLSGSVYRKCLSTGEWHGSAPTCKSPLCPELSNPDNGRAKLTSADRNVGAQVWYICNDGFHLVGSESRRCQSNLQWSSMAPTCQSRHCPRLNNPENGIVKLFDAGQSVGAKVQYKCHFGFSIVGSEFRRCQSNLQWSSMAPTCQSRHCPRLNNPENGIVKFLDVGHSVGAKVQYKCNSGFSIIGSEFRRCQSNLQWSSMAPTCQSRHCPQLNNPENGIVQLFNAGQSVGATVKYKCNSGFSIVGSVFRRCRSDLQWSSMAPTCQSRQCPRLEELQNGRIKYPEGKHVGAEVWYVCNTGFTLVGSESRRCQSDLQWSSMAPTCQPSLCRQLEGPENGQVKFSDVGRSVGAAVEYKCDKGFKLFGVETRLCQSNLKWSFQAPTCKPVCERLINPKNGHVLHNGTALFAFAKYSCEEGFYLVGDRFRRCVESGWTGKAPVCKPIKCTDLKLKDGRIFYTNFTNFGSVAKHRCVSGFKLSGNARRVCNASGNWTASAPTCIRVPSDCPSLPNPLNGAVEVDGLATGSTARYTCIPGYSLVGESERKCTDGKWSGEPPVCVKEVECRVLEAPEGGSVKLTGLMVGSTATYMCSGGYVLEGVQVRTCLKDGTWSEDEPRCRRIITCGDLDAPVNGDVDQPGNSVGTVSTYTCNGGYLLVGDNTRTCQDDGQWSGNQPICEFIVMCGDLSAPVNGDVDQPGNSVGTVSTYTCNGGYLLVGDKSRICLDDGKWSGNQPICEFIVMCGDLDAPVNGDVDQPGNSVGTVSTYTCNGGYLLVGDKSRTCQDDGKWSGSQPICEFIVMCGDLDAPVNGDVDQPGNSVGTASTYTCNGGYLLVGDKSRTCQKNGQWSGSQPICDFIVMCGDLSAPVNGDVDQPGNSVGTVSTYTCNGGYLLVGDESRTCQEDGKWSGSQPICEFIVMCGDLDAPVNGDVDQPENSVGTVSTYTCNGGYLLVGDDTRICLDDGKWSGSQPICEFIVMCGDLSSPANGDVDQPGNSVGTVSTYTCNGGYLLVGDEISICQDDGKWSGNQPICEFIVMCGDLSAPVNGDVDQPGNSVGTVSTYTCNGGYLLVGDGTRTCQDDGQWSGSQPICDFIVMCGDLDAPASGDVDQPENSVGTVSTYTCDSGYTLNGEDTRICQDNGKWSGEEPVCRAVDCMNLLNPRDGSVSLTGTIFTSVATYSCNDGFSLNGRVTRMCQADGTWSEDAPTCEPDVMCEDLSSPVNGMIMLMGRTPGSIAMYSCDMGFRLNGEMTRTCQTDGNWSNEEPTCISVDCAGLDNPTNGVVVLSGVAVGSTADYSCDVGYELDGVSQRMCQMDREWSGVAPTCEAVDCGSLDNPTNGNVEFQSTLFGSTAVYSCVFGYILEGTESRFCQVDGKWSGTEPVCIFIPVVSCLELINPSNGMVTVTGLEPFSTATYVCDPGYVLFGDEIRTCTEDGEWTKEEPTCQPIDCGPLTAPTNGRVEVVNTTLGSPAVYTCNLGYVLVGDAGRLCTETGDWSGVEPRCDLVECPALPQPDNGLVTLSGVTFGSLATYVCNAGFVLDGNVQRTCLATGEWSGSDPSCIVPPAGCSDPGVPDNGLRVGDDFSVGAAVFYRCFDDYDLVGAKFRVCQGDNQWSDSLPTCVRFNDTCSSAKDLDRCGRRCDCINGRLRNCCRVRKDYAGLTISERQRYITTFLTAAQDPIYKPRYDALIALWKLSFENNVTQSSTPSSSQYFMFVRYYLLEYENLLQDIDCMVTIPFYDWTPFPITPYAADVWDNTDGFGDTSRPTDSCVTTGPVRVEQFSITPSAGSGCLQRDYTNRRFPSRDIVDRDLLPLPSDEFTRFHRFLQLFIGLNVQCFVGGTMCGMNAANDPVHILHLARLDSILTRWQLIGQGREEVRYAFDNNPLLVSPGFRVSQFSNNRNLPYDSCAIYEPPVLLKNHAGPLPASQLGLRVELTRMDCVPMEDMMFMDSMMTTADHEFMDEQCSKPRMFRRAIRI